MALDSATDMEGTDMVWISVVKILMEGLYLDTLL